jgi:hypothetical protein
VASGFSPILQLKRLTERYLEVVLATPETFETKGDYSEKVQRLIFALRIRPAADP